MHPEIPEHLIRVFDRFVERDFLRGPRSLWWHQQGDHHLGHGKELLINILTPASGELYPPPMQVSLGWVKVLVLGAFTKR